MWQEAFVEILEANYERLKKKNSSYSRRAFAKKIAVSSGTLSDVTKHKTKLTQERAFEILQKLDLTDRERTRMFTLLGHGDQVSKTYSDESDLSILSDWKVRAVYYSFDLKEEFTKSDAISARTKIPVSEVEEIKKRLLAAHLIVVDEAGAYQKDNRLLKTTDGVASDYVKKVHLGNLEPLKHAITDLPVELRDITSMTFAADRKKIEIIRKDVRKLYEKIVGLMDSPNSDEVFEMTIAIFPLAQPEKK